MLKGSRDPYFGYQHSKLFLLAFPRKRIGRARELV
jgi:hypothetical protein